MKETLKKRSRNKYPPVKGSHPSNQAKNSRYSDVVGLAIIILLGIIIYSNSFNCSFHFDDYPNIVNNLKIRNLADINAWWNFYPSRPIGFFTFALNYHFNRLDVFYYHLVNLAIHLINACLVWWITLLIFSSPAMKDQPVAGNKKVLAFFTALLFVSHPLATQSVTYIWQRVASMVTMYYLLSIVLYFKARISNKGNIVKTVLLICSLISAVLAMLTKQNAFTLPFAIFLFEIFFLRTKKFAINFRDYRTILLLIAFLGIILIIPLKFSFSIFKPMSPALGRTYTITSGNYLLTQFSVIVKYIQLLFLPVNQNLDYDFPVSDNFFRIRTLLCFFILLSLIALAIFFFKKHRVISFGIFWFFLTLSIESSFIPLDDVIFEHRTYLPSFGFFLILSTCIYLLFWKKNKTIAIVIFVIIAGVNSFLTFERNKIWKDDLTLWCDVVSKPPVKARSYHNCGFAYGNLGQLDKAIDYYSLAIGINPDYLDSYIDRGNAYGNLGKWDKAIADYSRAIEIDPTFVMAWSDRGIAYGNLGQLDKAIADFSKAIEIDPKKATAWSNLGVAYWKLGKWDKSIASYSKALEIDPRNATIYYNRGFAYYNLGQWENAIADYTKSLELDPNNLKAYSDRENAYEKLNIGK
jgi:Flp pilus assembly protein TadD